MERLEHFWPALEAVPGRTLTLGEWRTIFGADYDVGERFLRPTARYAQSLPCGRNGSAACLRRVVEHGPDDLVAVCGESPRACDSTPVTKDELLLYEVEVRRLAEDLSQILGLAPRFDGLGHATWSLGEYPAVGTRRISVLLAIPNSSAELSRITARLPSGPVILLTPTRDLHGPEVDETLRRTEVQLAGLSDFLGGAPDGRLVAYDAALRTLLQCREDVAVFRPDGRVWELRFRGEPVHLPNEVGFSYIAVLLRFAHSDFHVSELQAVAFRLEKVPTLASAESVLSVAAGRSLRNELQRLKELRPEVTKREIREELEEKIKQIQAELNRAWRPNRRPKELGAESEKLRKSVSAAINRAIVNIRASHDDLANHLDGFIKRGVYFSYKPDSDIVWLTE